jgi:heat-inducible transcriptional repressor
VGDAEVAGADDVVRNASRLLSILSRHACVVVVSRFSHQAIRSISLLRAASDKILLVAVLQGGWVQHRLIEDEPGLTTDELEKINAYLNDMAVGLTLPQLRVKIMNEMRREKARYDSLMRRALLLGSKAIADSLPGEVYIEGRTNILEQPEFVEDVQKLKRILHAFEEKGTILRLLDSALESDAIQVSIGAENPVEELPEISVVSSGYRQGESAMGSIGLIGPVRMDYSRVIPLVEYTAHLLSSILEHR